jgi:hypothetical protein
LPWRERVDTLGGAIREVFSEAATVAGLVISSGLAVSPGADPGIEDKTTVTAAGVGLCRVLHPHLMRETFVIPLQSASREETDVWVAGYASEATWLAEDLQRAGLPPLAELWQP